MRDGMREVELILHRFFEDGLVIPMEGLENGGGGEDNGVRMSVCRWERIRKVALDAVQITPLAKFTGAIKAFCSRKHTVGRIASNVSNSGGHPSRLLCHAGR